MWELEAIAKTNYDTIQKRPVEQVEAIEKRIQVLESQETIQKEEVEGLLELLGQLSFVCLIYSWMTASFAESTAW